jgi:hypothetical protein
VHLGAWIGFDTEGHKPVYEALLSQSEAKLRQADSNNYHLTVRERFTEDGSAVLFVGNYYNEDHFGKVTYTHPKSAESISIPYSKNELLWPPIYGLLSPICLKVAEGISILHSTSDVLDLIEIDGSISIKLYGDRDLQGEIVFEGENVNQIRSVTLNGVSIQQVNTSGRIVLNYNHLRNREMIMQIEIQ